MPQPDPVRATQALVDSSHEGILVADPDGVILSMNPAGAKILGYDSPEEMIGMNAEEVYNDLEQRSSLLEKLCREGYLLDYEVEFKRKDGSTGFTSSTVTLHRDREGNIERVESFFRDITERKRVEEELRKSEERYRDLFELSPDVIMTGDMKGYITSVNAAFTQATGYPADSIVGKHFTKTGYLLVREIPKFLMRFSSIVRGRLPSTFEFQYIHKNGSARWAEAHVAFQELDGKKVGIHGMIRDITDRKQNEETLLALHRHARELARCPSLEEVYDHTVRVMTETLRFPRVDILMVEGDVLNQVTGSGGLPVGVQIPLDGKGLTVKAIREKRSLLVNDVSQSKDYLFAPGMSMEKLVENYPLSQSELVAPIIVGGEAIGVLNVEDTRLDAFTEQNKMFLELLAMHVASAVYRLRRFEELVTLVEEKTGELVDAERMVTAGRISSMVGHDLRGPLQTIKNSLYMMEHHPEKRDEMLKLIDSSVDYAVEMLEELRARTQEDKLRRQDTDLRYLLRRAVAEASVPENVDLDVSLGDGLGSIVVDPTQIRRVIDNLIRNAVEAMPDGGKLTVSSEVQGEDVELRVSDTGVGISEDELGNLFKPFYTTKSRGMGLGLVYCKRAVEAHGGTISVDSEVDKGTTFTVRLPMNR